MGVDAAKTRRLEADAARHKAAGDAQVWNDKTSKFEWILAKDIERIKAEASSSKESALVKKHGWTYDKKKALRNLMAHL